MDKYPWLFNIAMENGPFIDGLPIKHCDFHGYVKKTDGNYSGAAINGKTVVI